MRGVFLSIFVAVLASASVTHAIAVPGDDAADLFTVRSVKVEAAGNSPTAATNLALAQGRPVAWNKLFRRLTVPSKWASVPQLSDNQLQGLIRTIDIDKERRSTTRYVADVTFHFRPAAVRVLLRRSNIAFTETRSEPTLVIPLTAGKMRHDPKSPWAVAWANRQQQHLVPMVVPKADATIPIPTNIAQLEWADVEPMVRSYNAAQMILAIASEDARSVQMIRVTPTGRTRSSFAYTQSSFAADVEAIAEQAANEWKQFLNRPKIGIENAPIDDGTRTQLTVGAEFRDPEDWTKLRTRLRALKMVTNVQIMGLMLNEAEIALTFFGPAEQLRTALVQQNLHLADNAGQYTLTLITASAANLP